MQDENLITYKWNQGVYSLEDMVILVKYKNITPEIFFEITRFDYNAILEKLKSEGKKV